MVKKYQSSVTVNLLVILISFRLAVGFDYGRSIQIASQGRRSNQLMTDCDRMKELKSIDEWCEIIVSMLRFDKEHMLTLTE